jgi:FixJ family two-component response regulator
MPDSRLVCVVDDDPQVRDSLSLMLGLKGYDCRTYDSGESFLAAPPNRPCCLILDLKMGGMDGLALQQAIKAQAQQHEIIFLTAFADTEVMRSAFIEHAVDFLEKPVVLPRLLQALDTAFERLHQHTRISETQQRLDKLTPRERDVYEAIVEGLNHREVGDKLQISPRTVEVHKARIMEKLGVTTLAELLRFALRQP